MLGNHLAQFSFELGLLSPLSHISIFDYFDCVHSGTTPYLGGYRTGITTMHLSSVTTLGKIVTGRRGYMSIMAFPAIGAAALACRRLGIRIRSTSSKRKSHEPAAIILLPLWWPMR